MSLGKFFLGNGNYGFIRAQDIGAFDDLGNRNFREVKISGTHFPIRSTANFAQLAKNHCGATQTFNLSELYMTRHPQNHELAELKKLNDLEHFKLIHAYVPNGPVVFLARRIKRFFHDIGLDFKYRKISKTNIKQSLDNDKPVALLLADGLANWHWVLAIGYRIYPDGTLYLQLIDNHKNSTDSYYRINKGSWLAHACEYELDFARLRLNFG